VPQFTIATIINVTTFLKSYDFALWAAKIYWNKGCTQYIETGENPYIAYLFISVSLICGGIAFVYLIHNARKTLIILLQQALEHIKPTLLFRYDLILAFLAFRLIIIFLTTAVILVFVLVYDHGWEEYSTHRTLMTFTFLLFTAIFLSLAFKTILLLKEILSTSVKGVVSND
jgi:hypothetical protein